MPEKTTDESRIKVDIATQRWTIVGIVHAFLDRYNKENAEELKEKFEKKYNVLIKQHEKKDRTEILQYYRLISEFRLALESIMEPGQIFENVCERMAEMFDITLAGIQRQVDKKIRRPSEDGPVLPGSNKITTIKFFCTVCEEFLDVPEDLKIQLLNSDEKMKLPKHHDKELEIRIVNIVEDSFELNNNKSVFKIKSARELMGYSSKKIEIIQHSKNKLAEIFPEILSQADDDIGEYLNVLSVGIDVGSSTSHLVFSGLTLRREQSFMNMSNRFHLINRKLIYEGNIIDTPLIDRFTIDIDAVVAFFEEEYKKAGIKTEMVDTGAVIVTGETARKQNAEEIVRRLSSTSGKFVSAAAGPNFESLLGAMGSGIVDHTLKDGNTIMNIDIGGGTSNLAIASKGQVTSTSCINVGGRLLGIDKDFRVWRIDEPTEFLLKELNLDYKIGEIIPEKHVRLVAQEYAKALVEVIRGPVKSKITKKLMMTDNLDFSIPIDGYSFSGGVAEFIYGEKNTFDDIGLYLAEEIQSLMKKHKLTISEPKNKIRATVIGAGSFSLSVSGSTCYFDKSILFPLDNIPVINVNIRKENYSPEKLSKEIDNAFRRFDMKEGKDLVALYFKDPIYRNNFYLSDFAKAIEEALPNSVTNSKMVILIFDQDMGGSLGIALRRDTALQTNLICMDELELEEGDWIDIGAPLYSGQAFPITVKSLVFNKNKTSQKTTS
ncbi:MAG: ethanolamine ammonia-lyase reactivating factor EutA [Candidatus Heimdallarchaeaceae archaeon]